MSPLVDTVFANAWRGTAVSSGFAADADRWAITPVERPVRLLAPEEKDPDRWEDDAIGWGVIAPDTDRGTPGDRDDGHDLPEVIRELLAHRRGTVLRYRSADDTPPTHLWRYHAQRSEAFALPIGGSKRGRGVDAIPVFLLLLGGPRELPWSLQYTLNIDPRIHAGRLPLTGDALERYVTRLLDGWDDDPNEPGSGRAVVWSAEQGGTDITRLLRLAVADPVREKYESDEDVTVRTFAADTATVDALTDALATTWPGVVLTTSHGFTGPTDAPDPALLGIPVDTDHMLLNVDALLASWQPDGAVWYAHACCSAGCDAPSSFAGLFQSEGELDRMMLELAGIGPAVAPLPVALLGAERPARAFIGHVEPTFDWTLQDEDTGRSLLHDLTDALYGPLLLGHNVGRAISPFPIGAGALAAQLVDRTRPAVLAGTADISDALRQRISYLDRRSLVVLGDPTVALPSLAARADNPHPRQP